jgi:hypothetical protein
MSFWTPKNKQFVGQINSYDLLKIGSTTWNLLNVPQFIVFAHTAATRLRRKVQLSNFLGIKPMANYLKVFQNK